MAQAQITPDRLAIMKEKLACLIVPYHDRVGVAFIDLESSLEANINGHEQFPAASVAKVPVMVTAFHLADMGKLDLGKKVSLRAIDKQDGSGVLRWLRPGNTYTIQNLIRMMIVLSDNTATKMVVDNIGCARINGFVNTYLGLTETQVVDPTMLNEPTGEVVNLTSPCDMAQLVTMIEKKTNWHPDSCRQMLAYMKNQRYRWGLWRGVPPGIQIADKTGNLDNVYNDAGIIYSPTGRYALAIFTYKVKHREVKQLFINIGTTVYEAYTGQKVVQPKPKVKVKKKVKHKKKRLRSRLGSRYR